MTWYSFVLFGSNYLAPMVSGFIADNMGWRWVFYWPTIFVSIGIIFNFLFMEETNYVRRSAGITETSTDVQVPTETTDRPPSETINEKSQETEEIRDHETGTIQYRKKTYMQKLSLWNPAPGQPFLVGTFRILYYLTWPTVFYAG